MGDKPVTGAVTETPEADVPVADQLVLSGTEQTWVRNQQRKQSGSTSKYIPHQGARERARRLRRRTG